MSPQTSNSNLKSSKSFLSFMHRNRSSDSIKSDKSSDYIPSISSASNGNHAVQQHASNGNLNCQHKYSPSHLNREILLSDNNTNNPISNNHSNINNSLASYGPNYTSDDLSSPASPKPTHSMAELKRFFRPNANKKFSMTNLRSKPSSPTTSRSSSRLDLTSQLQNLAHGHAPNHSFHGHNNGSDTRQKNAQHHTNDGVHHNENNHLKHPSATRHHKFRIDDEDDSSHRHPHGSVDHQAHTQSAIPPTSDSILSLSNTINIYHDDAILAQKYGKLGKLLGSGAGGSVKILTRPTDGATFAVKEFRARKPNESLKEYAKKCTAEFCIGSSLHHPNVIETVDVFSDSKQNKYYEVMQYCPVDFFAVVMTGKMSRGEINCCFKQLTLGVRYLHSMGLAHRDLKLDNCVMTSDGVLKLIDFGSAVVFRYPFDEHITMAHGVVGSDPYLAPEVITSTKCYDPQAVDIWSIGIIYCCMMLKRFPWKAPKESDDNFRLFCMPDDIAHDYTQSAKHHEELLQAKKERRSRLLEEAQETSNGNARTDKVEQHSLGTNETAKEFGSNNEHCKANKDDNLSINNKEIKSSKQESRGTSNNEINEVKVDSHETRITGREEGPTKEVAPVHKISDDQHSTYSTSTEQKTIEHHKTQHHKRIIHGPYRLLRLLPHASRPVLSKILEVDPEKRITMDGIFDDKWFSDLPVCSEDYKHHVVRAPGHHHTIVREINGSMETYKI